MFQTEPVLWIQSFSSDTLTRFFALINAFGYSEFQIPIVIFILFAVHFHRGFLLIQALLWNSLLTDLFKSLFALPRPSDVDAAVRILPENVPNPTQFEGRGASGFFSGLSADVVVHFRSVPGHSYGLPSGHVSSILTLTGGAFVLFRRKPLLWFAVVAAVLMGITRMYFGRHFILDVIGGALLAVAVLAVLHWTISPPTRRFTTGMRGVYFLVMPLVMLPLPGIEAEPVARLLGINAAFLWITRNEMITTAVAWRNRLGSAFVGFVVYASSSKIIGGASETLFGETALVESLASFATILLALIASIEINLKIGFLLRERKLAESAVASPAEINRQSN